MLTNPDKLVYPGTTKQDIFNYYTAVAARMLPYISGRLLSLVRCPNGVAKDGIREECFYKKNSDGHNKHSTVVPVGDKNFYYISSVEGLLHEVQMNTIEFHTWGSRANKGYKSFESPDIMVFDLDPDEGMSLSKIRRGVLDLKDILDQLGLKSFLKTSGWKGYHVVVPFNQSQTNRTTDWDKFKNFSKNMAELMTEKFPDKYTTNIRKDARKGKIFIDYLRNTKGATSVAPYSLRAKDKPTVSMPIAWDELGKIAPNGITLNNALKRLNQSDPWEDFNSWTI